MSDSIRRAHRFTVVPEPLTRDPNVGDRAFRLWCILDRYAGAKDSSFPSRETLANNLRCSRASIDRALAELISAEWLSRESRKDTGQTSIYTLEDASKRAPEGGASPVSHPTDDAGGESPATQGRVTGDAQKEASPEDATVKDQEHVDADASTRRDLNEGREDVDRLCEHLHQRLTERGVKHDHTLKAWRDAARLMLDSDGRTEAQVHRMIDWSHRSEFWHPNIHSMPTLREKYDRMKEQALRDAKATPGSNVHRLPTTDPEHQRRTGYFKTGS